MKKILFTFLIAIAFSTGLFAQFTTVGAGGTWATARGIINNNFVLAATLASPTFTGTVTLPATWKIGAVTITPDGTELNILNGALVSATELNYLVGATSGIQAQLDAKPDTTNYVALGVSAHLITDTVPKFVFCAGSGAAADSVLFEKNDILPGGFNSGNDTTYVVNMRLLYMTTGDSAKINVYWGTRMTATATDSLFSAPEPIGTDQTTLTVDDPEIPPNKDVWMKMSGTQLTGKRPKQLEVQLNVKLIRD